MTSSKIALIGICLISTATGSGCSPMPSTNSSTSESVSVTEANKGGPCLAAITVQESVNGRKHSAHQANVPCANVSAVQSTLVTQAKQGL